MFWEIYIHAFVAELSDRCFWWFPAAMLVPISMGTSVASPYTNLCKFGEKVSPHIFHKKNCCDLNVGESVCIFTFFFSPDFRLSLLNGFDFRFLSILNSVTLKTSNYDWSFQYLTVLVEPPMTSLLSSFAKKKNVNICNTKKRYSKNENAILLFLEKPFK